MYKNIGNKIRVLAKVFFAVGLLGSIIGGYGIIELGGYFDEFKEFSKSLGRSVIFFGSLISWISTWVLYGFGELIQKTSDIEKHVSAIVAQNTVYPVEQYYDEQSGQWVQTE